ncbi:MAG: 16S rRNA (guanine(966)-N(2))-methyltransferase RsmD [bacterium]
MECMRVIAGTAGRRRLKTLPGRATRPTADRVKESLFAILGGRVAAARFLDLFAGTGNIGIEALSRGAAQAVFVEANEPAVRIIRANLELTGFAAQAEVLRLDVSKAIAGLAGDGRQFDLIYLDPPYEAGRVLPTLQLVARSGILAPGALLIAEHSRREDVPEAESAGIVLRRREKYGDTVLTFWHGAAERGN